MSANDESLFEGVDFGGVDEESVDAEWEDEPDPAKRNESGFGAVMLMDPTNVVDVGATRGRSAQWTATGADDGSEQSVVAARLELDRGGQITIAVWGAPRSGKTTFLRAMPFAAQEPVSGYLWNIAGRDKASREFLKDGIKQVIRDRIFPPASVGSIPLAWKFRGKKPRQDREGIFRWFADLLHDDAAGPDIEFVVEVNDVAGEVFAEKEGESQGRLREQMLDSMIRADGIVYVFDPIGTTQDDTNSFDYYVDTVERLKERAEGLNRMVGTGQLPQHVSVCVTKLDDPLVFEAAAAAGLVYSAESDALPEVPAEFAAKVLRELCLDEGSQYVCDRLEKDFVPSRIRYYVTSAVGFHQVDGRFDRADFGNGVGRKFRSVARPINVVEPIFSLYQRIVDGVNAP